MAEATEGSERVMPWAALGLLVSVEAWAQGPPPGMGMPPDWEERTDVERAEENVVAAKAELQAKPGSTQAHAHTARAYLELARVSWAVEWRGGTPDDIRNLRAREPELLKRAEVEANTALQASPGGIGPVDAIRVQLLFAGERGDLWEELRLYGLMEQSNPWDAAPIWQRAAIYRELGMPVRAFQETLRFKWRGTATHSGMPTAGDAAAIAAMWAVAHMGIALALWSGPSRRWRLAGRWGRLRRLTGGRWTRGAVGLAGMAGIMGLWVLAVYLTVTTCPRGVDTQAAYLWLHHRLIHLGLGLSVAWARLWLGRLGVAVGAGVVLKAAQLEWRGAGWGVDGCSCPWCAPGGDLVGMGLCLLALPLGLLMYRLWTREDGGRFS